MPAAVRVETRPDAVAVLTLDQPDSRVNVLTGQLWADLDAAITSLSNRSDLRGLVILSGKPGVFVAGADLKLLGEASAPNDPQVRSFIEHGLRVLEKLEALPFPTCAAVDGAALGGGLEIALACDIRIVGTHPKLRLGLPEVRLGLIPGWGGTQRLPRLVGWEKAAVLLTSGESWNGEQAVEAGLARAAVASDRLLSEAVDRLTGSTPPDIRTRKFAPMPATEPTGTASPDSLAAREALRVLREGAILPLSEGIKRETEAFMRLAGSPESKRLIGEFFAGRAK